MCERAPRDASVNGPGIWTNRIAGDRLAIRCAIIRHVC